MHPSPQIGEENGGTSYSPNVAYLAEGGGGGGAGFFSYFPPLKPGHVLWSHASYSPKNTVLYSRFTLRVQPWTLNKILSMDFRNQSSIGA